MEIAKDIEITDELGHNKTSMFTITVEDTEVNWIGALLPDVALECGKEKKKVTIKAKADTLKNASFYNNNYYFKIPVRKIKDYDMKIYYNGSLLGKNSKTARVPNTAQYKANRSITGFSTSISGGVLDYNNSSTVSIDIYGKINTDVVNGTIDEGDEKVPLGSSKVIRYKPNDGYELSSITINGEDVDITKYTTEYIIDNLINNCNIKVVYEPIQTSKGSITINKKGINDIHLQNVTFELYDNDKNLISIKETDENGKILFDNLEYGRYTLIETKTVPGYELNKDKIKLEVSDSNKNVEITVNNHKRTELPFTGGTGTILFIIIGLGLMITAIIITVIEKKKKK